MPKNLLMAQLLLLAWTPCTFAAPAPTGSSSPAPGLQTRVEALVQQVHLRYADEPGVLQDRREKIRDVLEAWNKINTPSAADREALSQWLRTSLDVMMPGKEGPLPAPPQFSESLPTHSGDVAESATDDTVPVQQPSEWSRHPAAAPLEWDDPFVDDPDEENQLRNPLRSQTQSHRTGAGPGDSRDAARLITKITTHNQALRAANRRVMTLEPTNLTNLEAVVGELERLAVERHEVDQERAKLTVKQAESLPEVGSAELVHELVRRKANVAAQENPDTATRSDQIVERMSRL